MEICDICHQPLKPNQPLKRWGLTHLAHLECYEKWWKGYRHLLTHYSIPAVVCFIVGLALIILGAIGIGDPSFIGKTGGIALLVIGAILFFTAIVLWITSWVKFFKLKKNYIIK